MYMYILSPLFTKKNKKINVLCYECEFLYLCVLCHDLLLRVQKFYFLVFIKPGS